MSAPDCESENRERHATRKCAGQIAAGFGGLPSQEFFAACIPMRLRGRLAAAGVGLDEVAAALESREGRSGVAEKAGRPA